MLAAWGDSTKEDEGTEEEDAAIALMARSDSAQMMSLSTA